MLVPLPANVLTTPLGVTFRMQLFSASATSTLPPASTAMPIGKLNIAFVPVPSAKSGSPFPASVDTIPPGVTLRMRWPPVSPTKTLPLESTATPRGRQNEAAVPAPSANAPGPPPASVLTTPPGVTFLMRLLNMSATKILPPESTATPAGLSNEAAAPVPSARPIDPLPASVLTTPVDDIFLMQLLL